MDLTALVLVVLSYVIMYVESLVSHVYTVPYISINITRCKAEVSTIFLPPERGL